MRKKYILSHCLIVFNLLCVYSQIVNEGVLQISSTTDVYFENEYTNKTSATLSANGNLYLNDSFINNGVTTSTTGTTYFKSTVNPLLSISGSSNNINFNNLEVDITATNTKGLSVADGFLLNISNQLNLVNGDVRLNGESQLIQSHVGLDANTVNSGKILVDQQGAASAFKYNYWSAPVNNGGTFSLLNGKYDGTDSNLKPFTPSQMSFISGAPYNGLPAITNGAGEVTTALSINTMWLYKYIQGTGSYYDWVALDQNSALNSGEGYTMKGTGASGTDQNYVFYGAPNNGEYTMSINAGEESLIGNPYPSAFDSNKFILDNASVFDALYFWVDGGSTSHVLSNYLGGYAIRNLTGGTPPSLFSTLIGGLGTAGSITLPKRYLPIGQGFFIKAYASGTIVFNNSQRDFKKESDGDAIFYRNQNEQTENQDQFIRLGYEDPEGFHRQLLLGFLPNSAADVNYNPGYDALLKICRDDEMFFVIEQDLDKKYAIQGVNTFNETMEFPLGLLISETGSHQIMIDEVENFQHTVYLKDNILNTTHNLTDANFNVNLPIGDHLDRYSLVFVPQNSLSTTDQILTNLSVFYDGNKNVVVNNSDRMQLKNITIYNVLGQEILRLNDNINSTNKVQIPFNQSQGLYVVKVVTTTGELTQKIINY
ncbi:T9SS type A sorting domain-containing protein [Olleya marilimosa]|uniref:T9SS type A sorting domain-containing protein n=1 Tax=Olleya marilimosa TaxID=272164 RepID=A0ABR8LZ43_9FLAO|nr:T9SS type A sorting domain-containing protein [Olleya marilimosa]MBD3863775.1 T9SS type A sorting domain-containing protein [Olleya marilimosa]MBD3890966.1 T9SS type A sorting domain-containing protein [Olleya marilimosa]